MPFVVDDLIYVGLILSAAAAAAQANASKTVIEKQSEAAVHNTNDQYKASSEQERLANVDAAEKLTDRMRDAKRQLSSARLVAAEGGGGLKASSDNILAGLTDDSSRIVAGLGAVKSGIRQDQNSALLAAKSSNAAFQSQASATRTKFMTDMAQIGLAAYGASAKKSADIKAAKGATSDYTLAQNRVYLRGNQ